ncbi:hypothetical protein LMJ53_03885 [Rheinheimera sp. UJ51]|uniref:TolB family protein n=1 Tax=unclassified Rheinheimera TaxID=115860 RepID=UPI001E5D4625|nr:MULTISPECIES: hypothetical protein [unclassified Rheinheimera]MCC5450876.1 hypothetical protein [Rheinheimera sp. UJ51]MCF4008451.1 hypothetical protein [Rheinheimera sp. UJ63]
MTISLINCAMAFLLLSSQLSLASSEPPLAFVSIRDGNAHIYVREGQHEHALTQGDSINTQPAWSNDGKTLAFSSVRNGLSSIYLIDADGNNLRRLNQNSLWQTAPSWSADSKNVAYLARDNSKAGMQLHIWYLPKRQMSVVADNDQEKGPDAPVWSDDGQQLVFLGSNTEGKTDVWIVNKDGSNLRNISQNASNRNKAHPSISKDSRYIAYVADMRGHLAIMRFDLQTGETLNLTADKPAAYETPRWSPDSQQLVFASSRDDPGLTRMDIFVMNADGSAVKNLSQHPHEDFNPHWTADGQQVVYSSLRTGTTQIFFYDLTMQHSVRISRNQSHDMDQVPQPVAVIQLQTAVSVTKGGL